MKFLIASLALSLLTGCATKVVVISSDKYVWWAEAGTTLTNGAWVVPDARMQQILRKLNEPDR